MTGSRFWGNAPAAALNRAGLLVLSLLGCFGRASAEGGAEPAAPVELEPDGEPELAPAEPMSQISEAARAEIEAALARRFPLATPVVERVLNVLAGICGSNPYERREGDDHVRDVAQLVATGDIVPGSSVTSPLFRRLRLGMALGGGSCASDGEMALLAQFIDELNVSPVADCEPAPFMTHGESFTALAADISTLAEQDRPFIRYLGLTYASNAGECGEELDRQRHALFKLINSVSTGPLIRVPQPVDGYNLLYRIDLRSYGWDRAIDLEDDGVLDFDDAWLAIVDATGAYAVEFAGGAAELLKQSTGSAVPFLPANVFVHASTIGDLYYALIGARNNLFDTALALGVAFGANVGPSAPYRAGFKGAGQRDSRVTRLEQGNHDGRSYWTLEEGMEGLFADPLGGAFTGGLILFNLANGLQAYAVAGANGQRLSEVPYGTGGIPSTPLGVINAADCHSCHNSGIVPVADLVREFTELNPDRFEPQTIEAIRDQYVPDVVFKRLVEQDGEVHTEAVAAAAVPQAVPDPISHVFALFERGKVTAEGAAGELGVRRLELLDSLYLLDPRLMPLGLESGYVTRDLFDATFADAMCALHGSSPGVSVRCDGRQ